MTRLYVYRGITYTKEANENVTVKNEKLEKLYRGAAYFKLPKVKHHPWNHFYRGAQYVA